MSALHSALAALVTGSASPPAARAWHRTAAIANDAADDRLRQFGAWGTWSTAFVGTRTAGPGDDDEDEEDDDENDRGGGNIDPDDDEGYDDEEDDDDEEPLRCHDRSAPGRSAEPLIRCAAAFRGIIPLVRRSASTSRLPAA